jgi:hypothetical protein
VKINEKDVLTIQGVSLDTAEPCDVVDMARLDTVLADDDAVAWARRVAEVNAERAKRADMVMMTMDEERNSVNQESVGISNTGQTGNYMTSYNAIQLASISLSKDKADTKFGWWQYYMSCSSRGILR